MNRRVLGFDPSSGKTAKTGVEHGRTLNACVGMMVVGGEFCSAEAGDKYDELAIPRDGDPEDAGNVRSSGEQLGFNTPVRH